MTPEPTIGDYLNRATAPRSVGNDDHSNTFAGHECATRSAMGGTQHRYKFANGYGASVVRNDISYGHETGLWELAVLGRDGRLTYDTPITSDVIGHLTEDDVAKVLGKIEALS